MDLEPYRLAQELALFNLYQQPYEVATISVFQMSKLRPGEFEKFAKDTQPVCGRAEISTQIYLFLAYSQPYA